MDEDRLLQNVQLQNEGKGKEEIVISRHDGQFGLIPEKEDY